MPFDLLVDPRATGAYFADTLAVARAELMLHAPGCTPSVIDHPMFTRVRVDIPRSALPTLARLSFVQGIFAVEDDRLTVEPVDPEYRLPAPFVYGAKYRGKTHETLTLLALNVARATCTLPAEAPIKVLDPMAGRGTTLLWAARLGWSATGIERQAGAIADLQRHVKKQCKLLRIKHKETRGTVGRKGRGGTGTFVRYRFADSSIRLITGDARTTRPLLQAERFPLIVSDLPYGIQHTRDDGWRDPSATLRACAPEWADRLAPGGSMVLCFNAFLPKRELLLELFTNAGLQPHPFTAPHRMSESILRDVVVFTKPA
jgi:hypothetical protein